MKTLKTTLLIILSFIFSAQSFAFEHELTSICKHPSKDILYVAGEFNTIILLDANSGKIIDQIDVSFPVVDMQFNKDGSQLLVESDDRKVHFIHPETGEESKAIMGEKFIFSADSPYFLNVSWIKSSVTVYDATNGRILHTIKAKEPLSAGFNADFSKVLILGRSYEIAKEKSLITVKVEEADGYNPFNKAYIEQQNDGEGCDFLVYDLASEEISQQFVLPYDTHDNFDLTISAYGDKYFVGAWDILLQISNDGSTLPIEPTEASFTYASEVSSDGKYLFLATNQEGNILDCETGKVQRFNVAQDFFAPTAADLTRAGEKMYLLSQDYTIITLDNYGVEMKRFQIKEGLANGFGVYYYNGNDEGEDRNAEAAIINKVRAEHSWEAINLDETEESEYAHIGSFDSKEKAEAFIETLDENDLNYKVVFSPLPKSK